MGAQPPRTVGLFTDFGQSGPYVGQLSALLVAARVPHFHLQHDAPAFDAEAGGALLAALCRYLPEPTLLVAVVDPGVGGERKALLVRTANHWFVGPDNGLLAPVIRQFGGAVEEVLWRPCRLSDSFHGRDLFVPLAIDLVGGGEVNTQPLEPNGFVGVDGKDDLPRVVYRDVYGNLVTGVRAVSISVGACVVAGGHRLYHARTFSGVPKGIPFWYVNSIGLVELAVNCGKADQHLGMVVGDPIRVESPSDIQFR